MTELLRIAIIEENQRFGEFRILPKERMVYVVLLNVHLLARFQGMCWYLLETSIVEIDRARADTSLILLILPRVRTVLT